MIERNKAMRLNPAAYPRILLLPAVIVVIGYLAGYVLLDWISFVEPYTPANITPWNPHTGLSFVLVLLFGRRMIPLLFIGPLLADFVVNLAPVPWVVELSFVALIGGGYSAALVFLLRPSVRFDPALSSMRDLVLLIFVAGVSAAFVASSYVGVAILAGVLPIKDFASATLRYWIGDMIGIMVVTPFLLIVTTRKSVLRMSLETVLQVVAIIGALVLMLFAEEQRFQLFYFLFLPVVWMAVRTGLEGVSAGIVITQFGLIAGVTLYPAGSHNVTGLQTLMLVLAMTGLIAGELVTEHRRTESRFRLHLESLSRIAQLGGMGELAVAIAHELNQPLMAARTYTRLVDDEICSGSADTAMIAETARKAVAQVERAAEVVRSLRALVRLDHSTAEQQRADVVRARRRWVREQGMFDPARLVFIDETSTNFAAAARVAFG